MLFPSLGRKAELEREGVCSGHTARQPRSPAQQAPHIVSVQDSDNQQARNITFQPFLRQVTIASRLLTIKENEAWKDCQVLILGCSRMTA